VAPSHRNIVKRADIVADGEGDATHYEHRDEESERSQEEPLPPRFCESVFIDSFQPGVRNDGTQAAEDRGQDDGENPEAAVSPEHLFRSCHAPRRYSSANESVVISVATDPEP
jgi:hypothetical protein